MISQEKGYILTPLQKLIKNVGDLAKLILPRALKTCPKFNKSPNLVTLILSNLFLNTIVIVATLMVRSPFKSRFFIAWGAPIAQWIRLRLPPCCPGFESQAHHLIFFQFEFKL